jgi:hypothetical protein
VAGKSAVAVTAAVIASDVSNVLLSSVLAAVGCPEPGAGSSGTGLATQPLVTIASSNKPKIKRIDSSRI